MRQRRTSDICRNDTDALLPLSEIHYVGFKTKVLVKWEWAGTLRSFPSQRCTLQVILIYDAKTYKEKMMMVNENLWNELDFW